MVAPIFFILLVAFGAFGMGYSYGIERKQPRDSRGRFVKR